MKHDRLQSEIVAIRANLLEVLAVAIIVALGVNLVAGALLSGAPKHPRIVGLL